MPKATSTKPSRAARGAKGKGVATENTPVTVTVSLPTLREFKAQKAAMRMSLLSGSGTSLSEGPTPLPRLADYKAQKETQRELDIANKMAEAATLQRVSDARQTMLSSNTVNQYLRYERHWVAWCSRRNYPDACVIPERASRYMEENIAEHPDPEKGIEPLRVRADNRGKNKRGPVKMVPPSAQTVDMYIKCLVNLYNQQCADPAYPMMTLQTYPNPRKYLAVVKDVYENRLCRVKAAKDIGSIGLVQGGTSASLRQLMRAAWVRSFVVVGKKGQRKRNSLRDRLDICWLHFMMCRGESTRKARLPDLFFHEVTDPSGGGQFTLGVVLLMLQGKTNKSGRQNYGVVVRNKDVQICPVGALALYMFEYWTPTIQASLSDSTWLSFHLVSGNAKHTEITNTAQYLAQRAIMQQANVKDRKKVTHRGRIHGSQYAQACGASVEAIAQHGNWSLNRLSTHYLSRVDAGVALHMAGFTPPNERLWLLRNNVIPSVELQRLVFPFIEDQFPGDEDWKLWIENIMLDRDVFHGRKILLPRAEKAPSRRRGQQNASTSGDEAGASDDDCSNGNYNDDGDDDSDDGDDDGDDEQDNTIAKRRHLILLAHLRKVVLQDAAVLMDLGAQDEQCRYHNHHVFDHTVFKTQLFIDFRALLHANMLTATSPITDSLAVNAPGIHSHLRSVESRVVDLSRTIESELGSTRSARERNDRAMNALAATTSRNINASLGDIQRQIQNLRNESTLNNEALKRVVSRIATQVNTIITEEISPLSFQQQPTSEPATINPSLDYDVDTMDLDLDLEAPDAFLTSVAPPPQLGSLQESSSVQHEAYIGTQPAPASNDSISTAMECIPEPGSSSSCPLGRAPSTIESAESLMAMISATATASVKPLEMPAYSMLPRDSSVDDLWQEWFYGVNGNPSLLLLNQWYGSSWRRGPSKAISNANAVMYLFKKNIVHAVLRSFPHDCDKPLVEKEAEALSSIRSRIERVGSISLFARSLPKKAPKRKPKGTPQEADEGTQT